MAMNDPRVMRLRDVGGGAVALAALMLSGCGGGDRDAKRERPPPQAGYVVVQPTRVANTVELVGRTSAYATAEVRPQVSGILQRRLFEQGSYVRAGQTLFQIDPSLYAASLAEARAALASARANAEATQARAGRYKPLAQIEAVSQQDYVDAAAAARQARASAQQARAQLETARINLRYTRVPAPISGRIGRSLYTQGALVTADQANPLAVIQQLDPIYVDLQQSVADLLALRRALAQGGLAPGSATVELRLEDGTPYPARGTVQFAEALVDPATGTVTMRATFPNRDGMLLPGMFVRARFVQSVDRRAFLVPQQGVSRDPRGRATVLLVGPGDKAVQRSITATRTQGTAWVVTDGLRPGDKVIVQGTGTIRPGRPIRPVPASAPQRVVPPKPRGG
jgi:membrane fusion protein (multidrug efflux system)